MALTAFVLVTGTKGGDGGSSGGGNTIGAVDSLELGGKALGASLMAVVAGSVAGTWGGTAANARSGGLDGVRLELRAGS